jgi:hypothetical protein
LRPCPKCGAAIQAYVFPAIRHVAVGKGGEALLSDTEASCFYHPQKKAAAACETCGRFLCALCDVDFNGRHLCPACIEAGKKKGKMTNLENRRVLHDHIALSLAFLPILIYPLTFVTAPAALYYAIRYWKTPSSILPRTRIRNILAIFIALMQIAAWCFVIYKVTRK